MVECNELSSLTWSLREATGPGRQSLYLPPSAALSHPPASKDACLGFPSDLLSHPSPGFTCVSQGVDTTPSNSVSLLWQDHHLAWGPIRKALSATESGEAAVKGCLPTVWANTRAGQLMAIRPQGRMALHHFGLFLQKVTSTLKNQTRGRAGAQGAPCSVTAPSLRNFRQLSSPVPGFSPSIPAKSLSFSGPSGPAFPKTGLTSILCCRKSMGC